MLAQSTVPGPCPPSDAFLHLVIRTLIYFLYYYYFFIFIFIIIIIYFFITPSYSLPPAPIAVAQFTCPHNLVRYDIYN